MKKLNCMNGIRKAFSAVALLATSALTAFGANTTTTVSQVSGEVTLSDDVDYVITDADPFADGAVLNITNTENAVVILTAVKPSKAGTHLNHILINGEKAVKNTNCMVKIYADGCIILPHGSAIKPLTVYTGAGCTGESAEYAVGYRQSLENNALNNRIQSFTLKRGYMVWFANKSSSTDPGYNRIFIADKADLTMDLPGVLSSSVSALRVSQWNDTSKKGCAGGGLDYNDKLNTTWSYGWDAGINIWDDHEYVTIRQHKNGWPSYTDVANNGTSANALHFNEPDNTNDDNQIPATVAEALAQWPEMMATGRRIGSPAMASSWSWLYEFIDSIDSKGWRCDFIAVHSYWYSDWSSWNGTLSGVHNRTGRPIWITEMNYGANWTGWPAGDDRSGSASNYAIELQHFGPVIDGLENTKWLERYAVYNWVEDCRMVIDGSGKLTPMGEYYANKPSNLAYSSSNEYVPKIPKMKDPSDFTVRFDKKSGTATLSWKDYNGEMNTSMTVMRKMPGTTTWEEIGSVPVPFQEGAGTYTYEDPEAKNGCEYRVYVTDGAGVVRKTTAQTAAIENIEAGDELVVNGETRYVGGNLAYNGDFDLGMSVWTDGAGDALSSDHFTVLPVGGVDGGAYLQSRTNATNKSQPGALKLTVAVEPASDYYFCIAVRNGESGFHRLNVIGEEKDDSVVVYADTQKEWSNTIAYFNTGSYSQAAVSCYRMAGKSQIDKVVICPLFATREEAIVDGVHAAIARGQVVVDYLMPNHPELAKELEQVLLFEGENEEALIMVQTAIANALQAAAETETLATRIAEAEVAVSYALPGHEELTKVLDVARAAASGTTTAADRVEALATLTEALYDYFPYIYSADYLKYPTFEYSTGWTEKAGTYQGRKQDVATLAGKTCYSAKWTEVSAEQGEAMSMTIYQTTSELAHGFYALECKAATDHNCLSDQHGWMAVGEDTLTTANLSYAHADIPAVADSAVWETLSTPMVYVEEGGKLTVGFTGSKKGATDYAWKEIGNTASTGDLREGWWAATDFTFRYLPLYKRMMEQPGWGVICLPYAITVGQGVQLYSVAGLTADYSALCLTEVTEPQAGIPYIYYSPVTEIFFYESGEAASRAETDGGLRGNFVVASKVPYGAYYMKGDQMVRLEESEERPYMEDYSGIIRKGVVTDLTVYENWTGTTLPIVGAAEEKLTGIDAILADGLPTDLSDGLYTLDGRRISEAQAVGHGVCIRVENGKAKKVVY